MSSLKSPCQSKCDVEFLQVWLFTLSNYSKDNPHTAYMCSPCFIQHKLISNVKMQIKKCVLSGSKSNHLCHNCHILQVLSEFLALFSWLRYMVIIPAPVYKGLGCFLHAIQWLIESNGVKNGQFTMTISPHCIIIWGSFLGSFCLRTHFFFPSLFQNSTNLKHRVVQLPVSTMLLSFWLLWLIC